MSFTTSFLRYAFKRSDDKRDAGLTVPEDLECRRDIVYGTDRKWQVLDVYRPKEAEGKLPVIVSIHGGGWTYGDKERYQWYCMDLAERGFAVVNFTYRVAPEFKFPSSMEDTCLVFDWILKNDAWFDLDRVFAVGDSAGAHMLTMYCALGNDESYAAEMGVSVPKKNDGSPFVPNAVGLNCGVYGIDVKNLKGMMRSLMKALLKDIRDEKETRLIAPLPYLNEKFPRVYVMTANQDPLAGPPAQENLVNKLKELGIEYIDRTYGSKEEPLGHVFHCDIRSAAAKRCNDDECAFFLKK